MAEKQQIIVRFPPSPTGLLHMGNVRTALYNYLFAKQNGGKFLIRVEDTDKARSKKEYEEDMFESMKWLGLEHDNKGEEWRQSERGEVYKKYLDMLLKSGAAYLAEESTQPSPESFGMAKGENKEVVRFRNPGGKIKFEDLIRGEVEMEVGDLNDFIIARNVEEPLYHLAVVVDDLESGITHIIRGEDHISNTPRQILIWKAIAEISKIPFEMPKYAHLPMILATDKSKLSKRKHGEAVSLKYYRDKGYESEAILNFLALVGWNPGGEKEIFSLEELVEAFKIEKVQKKGGIFDLTKLRWVNKEHMKLKKEESKNKIEERVKKYFPEKEIHPSLVEILFERIEVISDIDELVSGGELDYFFKDPRLEKEKIAWKNQTKEEAKESLEKILGVVGERSEIEKLGEKMGKGNVFWPLRYALSGKEKSPDPLSLVEILGIEESKKRIKNAIEIL